MNINATLFVQAINFLIAYFLFRFILLKPAYREIVLQESEQEKLEGIVAADERSIEEAREQRAAQWQACQRDCRKDLPEQIHEVEMFRGIAPKISVHAPSLKELRSMKERVSQTIISCVEGADGTD